MHWSKKKSLRLSEELRKAGIVAAESFGKDSDQGTAPLGGSGLASDELDLGPKEAIDFGVILVREMETGAQESVEIEKVAKLIKERLKNDLYFADIVNKKIRPISF